DGFKYALGIDLRGKRELHENAVNIIVAIEVFNNSEKVKSVDRGRRRKERAGEAKLFAGRDFAFHVELRGGIFADQYGGESRANPGGGEQADFVAELSENLIADFGAVEDTRGHSWLAFFAEGKAAAAIIAQACVRTLEAGVEFQSGESSPRSSPPPVFFVNVASTGFSKTVSLLFATLLLLLGGP